MLNAAPDNAAIRAAVLCVFNYSADWIKSSLTLTCLPYLIRCYWRNQHTHPLACDVWFLSQWPFGSWIESSRWSSVLTYNYMLPQASPGAGGQKCVLSNQILWCEILKRDRTKYVISTHSSFLSHRTMQLHIRQCTERLGQVTLVAVNVTFSC